MKTLVVTPSGETIARLERIFSQAPFTVDWQALLVPLAVLPTGKDNVATSNQVYFARFKNFQIAFDQARQAAELVGVLDSPDMLKRSIDLGMPYTFELKLIFLPYAPALSQTVRNFMISVSDTLVLKESHNPFSFKNEYLLG